ncbi:hypothetical protein [Tsukamurella sp. 1534]|uniref:hypothetical protein n=1 Tax=Tsukamurella sp. 1534 TaxID=1151061 RepID=UPI000313A032|nr:hypothetical protein [Tsukamurella sp. 1534]
MIPSTISDFDVDAAFEEIIAAEWPRLEGRQTPNSLVFTPGITGLGAKACELGRRSASRINPMPFQAWSLDQIMAKDGDGKWTHPECCLIIPRQNGKSLALMLRVLYGLFKLGERIVFSAHQWETAKALWKRTWSVVKTTPWMRKHVESHTCSQGRGTIVLASGAEVVFTTRSANAGRGLDRVDLVIYDEAYDLTEADMAALSPTKMAADDPQTIYTSSAVNQDQHPNGHVLAAVRRRGLACEEGLFFAEWMAPEELDRADHDTWRWANPAFGVIQTVKKLAAEYVAMSTAAGRKSFDVEYLGRGDWPIDAEYAPPVIDMERFAALTNPAPELVGSAVVALAPGPDHRHGKTAKGSDRRRWAIVAAQHTADARVHGEVGSFAAMNHDEVVRYVSAVVSDWDPAAVVLDARLGAVLAPKLRAAGIEPELLNTAAVAQSADALLDDIESGAFSHSGQDVLAAAAAAAQIRTLPQGDFVFQTLNDTVPVVAIALAHQGVLRFASKPAEKPAAPSSGLSTGPLSSSQELDVMTAAF